MTTESIPRHNLRIMEAMGKAWGTCMEISERVRRMGGKESPQAVSARIRENRLIYGVDYEKRVRVGSKGTWEYRLA